MVFLCNDVIFKFIHRSYEDREILIMKKCEDHRVTTVLPLGGAFPQTKRSNFRNEEELRENTPR